MRASFAFEHIELTALVLERFRVGMSSWL
jgi:hypothetical protein